jgi:hypothetical protein
MAANALDDVITEQKLVRILPFKPRGVVGGKMITWGNIGRAGAFTKKVNGKTVVIDDKTYMTDSLTIGGMGMLLNLENDEHKKLYEIFTESEQWKGVVATSKDKRENSERFYIENPQEEAVKYLEDSTRKDELIVQLHSLKDEQLPRFALMFGLAGTKEIVRANLRQMTETAEGRRKLTEIMLSPDRNMMELLAVAEHQGNAEKQEGLWKTPQGVYMWNKTAIGVGKDSLLAFFKDKKNTELYNALKEKYGRLS